MAGQDQLVEHPNRSWRSAVDPAVLALQKGRLGIQQLLAEEFAGHGLSALPLGDSTVRRRSRRCASMPWPVGSNRTARAKFSSGIIKKTDKALTIDATMLGVTAVGRCSGGH